MIPALLKGETLGKTIYNVVAAVLALLFVAALAYVLISGRFWKWKAERAETRADNAEAVAETATKNADNANGAAENASLTRGRMTGQTLDIRVTTEQAATRAENYGDPDTIDAASGLPADLVRELDDAEDRTRAAEDRLRRARSGRADTAPPEVRPAPRR